jgi:hypothetical protein
VAEDIVQEPRRWRRDGWTAVVIRNDDADGGWAVETWRDGDTEPALVGPWTMGRDKKNPKPLDSHAFVTLVKTAKEVLARHTQQARAAVHKGFTYTRETGQRIEVSFDVAGDEDDPHAIVTCTDAVLGELVGSGRVPLGFRMSATSVEKLLRGDLG